MRARFIPGILLLGLLGLLGVFSGPLGASPVLLGGPFRLDAAPDCREREPDLAPRPNGGFVAVWTGDSHAWARLFDAAGTPAGPAIQVDAPTGQANATVATVATALDGSFLVVWHDDVRDQITSRLFSAAGAPLGTEKVVAFPVPTPELDVAAVPGGGFAVLFADTASALLRLVDEDGELENPLIFIEGYFGVLGVDPRVLDPAIAVQPDGDLVVLWTVRNSGPLEGSYIDGRLIPISSAQGGAWRNLEFGDFLDGWITEPAVGVDAAGNIVVAWTAHESENGPPLGLRAQVLDPTGHRVNPAATPVATGPWARLGGTALLVNPDGSFVLAWHALLEDTVTTAGSAISAQTFSSEGVPQGNPVQVTLGLAGSQEEPALVRGADGEVFAAWQEGRTAAAPACFSAGVSAQRLSPGCVPGAGRLCLGDGRFQLETTWVAPSFGSGSGPGHAVQITRDTGYFWFFDPANVELMVKVLDGRAVNGKFWVFYGSLSNVAWRLRVTDLVTGAVKNYDNPRNQLASRGDTDALPGATTAESFELRPFQAVSVDAAPSHTPGEGLRGPCTPRFPVTEPPVRPGLCLNDERFEVEVTWHDPFNGGQGAGQGVQLTDDSGYFWFFDPANVELVVKALDGRAVNGKFWFFYGALTNVEYDIRVRHFSGDEKTYHNPPFQFLSRADTAAFTPTSCPCLPVNVPVCGKDGVTYQNECQARCVGYVEVARAGAC